MGHKEDLIAGAKRCLYEQGYAHTTARDIVAASGTNLASIGYHFGSKEALLDIAMIEAIEEWGEQIEQALAVEIDPAVTTLERFEITWNRVIASLDTHRMLWVATFEAMAQAERSSQVRAFLADALQQGRLGLATLFQNSDTLNDEKLARTVGSLYQALMTGVLVQWLLDPHRAPHGSDLREGLQMILRSVQGSELDSDKR